jgi:hypothetical protein
MLMTDGCVKRDGRMVLVQKAAARPVFDQLKNIFGRPYYQRKADGILGMEFPFYITPPEWKKPVDLTGSALERHYWRGAFDGDGAISAHLDARGWGNKLYMRMSFFWAAHEPDVGEAFLRLLDRREVEHGTPKRNSNSKSFKVLVRAREIPSLSSYLYKESELALPWKRELALADPAEIERQMIALGKKSMSGYL